MDIRSYGNYPSNVLSNFAANSFVFEGVECASMEGLLQSFKFCDRSRQLALCQMVGLDAKYAGRAGNGWMKTQTLHWNGVEYDRHGVEYQMLIARAFTALTENERFLKALLRSRGKMLTHSVGHNVAKKTVLTAEEFCATLMSLRHQLQHLPEPPNTDLLRPHTPSAPQPNPALAKADLYDQEMRRQFDERCGQMGGG